MEPNDLERLSPCPFCGSSAQDTTSNGIESMFVVCNTCGAEGPPMPTEQEAITAWCTRAALPCDAK